VKAAPVTGVFPSAAEASSKLVKLVATSGSKAPPERIFTWSSVDWWRRASSFGRLHTCSQNLGRLMQQIVLIPVKILASFSAAPSVQRAPSRKAGTLRGADGIRSPAAEAEAIRAEREERGLAGTKEGGRPMTRGLGHVCAWPEEKGRLVPPGGGD
jgi:hypothetical protein